MSCKINSSRLIKLTFNELNRIVTSDEFLTKLFLVLESTNISNRITRSQLPARISKKHIYRNQGKASTAMDLYALHTEKHEKGNMNGYAL